MADEGWLWIPDIAQLTPHDRLPIFTGLTCAINHFANPGFESLGEVLVTTADRGAIAVWAPSGLSSHSQAKILAEALYRNAAHEGRTIGDAARRALRDLAERGGSLDMLRIYNLLGDPTLPMP